MINLLNCRVNNKVEPGVNGCGNPELNDDDGGGGGGFCFVGSIR